MTTGAAESGRTPVYASHGGSVDARAVRRSNAGRAAVNELDQSLLTGEKIVFATKKHWFSPVRDSALAVLIVLGSFLLRWLSPEGDGAIVSGIGNVFDLVANIALIA